MAKRDMPKVAVTYKGVFSFKEIYKLIHDYLAGNGFVAMEYPDYGSGADPDLYEKRYVEKGTPKEVLISWSSKNEVTDYYRWVIDVDFQGTAIADTEVMVEGKKAKMDKGEIKIALKGYLETDYQKKFEKHWLLKNFAKHYDEKIMASEAKEEEGTLASIYSGLHTQIKRYFRLMGGEVPAEITPPKKA